MKKKDKGLALDLLEDYLTNKNNNQEYIEKHIEINEITNEELFLAITKTKIKKEREVLFNNLTDKFKVNLNKKLLKRISIINDGIDYINKLNHENLPKIIGLFNNNEKEDLFKNLVSKSKDNLELIDKVLATKKLETINIETSFLNCCYYGNLKVLKKIVEKFNIDNVDKNNALVYAMRYNHLNIFEFLIKELNFNITDIVYTCLNNHNDKKQYILLLKNDVDLELRKKENNNYKNKNKI